MSVNMNVTVPTGFARVIVASPSSEMLLLRHRSEAAGEPAQDRERECRVLHEDLLEVPASERQATRGIDRDDLGDARQPVEHRQLPEEVAGPQDRDLLAITDDPDGAIDEEEESGTDLALPGDHALSREVDLDRPVGDHREMGRVEPREQAAGASSSVRRSWVSVTKSSSDRR